MLRKLYCTALLSLVSLSLGCAVCCSPDDCNYAAYGGRWQRHEMASGRVSSLYAEAGYDSLGNVIEVGPAAVPAAEPATEPEPQPGDDRLQPVSYDQVSSYIE